MPENHIAFRAKVDFIENLVHEIELDAGAFGQLLQQIGRIVHSLWKLSNVGQIHAEVREHNWNGTGLKTPA